jgi:type III pantothenate kinase
MKKNAHMTTAPFLLIDAGNSRLKWTTSGVSGAIRVAGEIATKEATPAWIGALAGKFPEHRTVLASVVPKLTPAFRRAFAGRLHSVNGDSPALGLRFDYPKPGEIGADRLAAAAAVHADGIWPVIVVSCGTATAFTVLDAKGRLCGGVIAPGLHTQLAALLGATAQLPATALRPHRSALARSTEEAIRAGVMLNFQGGVKEIIHQLSKAFPDRRPRIVLTGGNAPYLTKSLDFPHTLRPLLVFEGLRMIGMRAWCGELRRDSKDKIIRDPTTSSG